MKSLFQAIWYGFMQVVGVVALIGMEISKRIRGYLRRRRADKKDRA